jgi:hypothetical protein
MPSAPANNFQCNSCGHQFAANPSQIANQPVCPKCRTFGQIVAAGGAPVRKQVVKINHPGAAGPKPAAYGSPVAGFQQSRGAGAQADDDVVEVSADVVYGKRKNTKSMVNGIILVVIGLATVAVLWILVSALKEDRSERMKQEKEVVLDPKDFERAVNDSITRVRKRLALIPGAEIQETTNFDEALQAITDGGGVNPGWGSSAPVPGQPFKSYGFVVKTVDPQSKLPLVGFIMLLYYKTAPEVGSAESDLKRWFGNDTRNYMMRTDPTMWFASYGGVNYKGAVYDALIDIQTIGKPSSYKQFTDRVGATMKDQ